MQRNNTLPKTFAFYGSLRAGYHNHYLVERGVGTKFEGVVELNGYKMFDIGNGAFPFVVKTTDASDTITVELYTLPDREYAGYIHGMELGAGYGTEEVF